MATKTKTNPYVTQAEADALVRYGPEYSALKALMEDAQSTRDTSISSARSTSDLIRNSVDQARPAVSANYDQAQQQATAQQAVAAPALANVGGAFAAAAALEQSGLASRLAESKASSLTDLQNRKVGATEGAAYATTSANRQYASDAAKIAQRLVDLSDEKGAYTASTALTLQQAAAALQSKEDIAAAGNTQSERDSIRSSGIDPDTGQPIPGGKLDPHAKGNGGWASSSAQAKTSDSIQEAITEAQTLKQAGANRAEAANLLLSGADATDQPIYKTVPVKNAAGIQTGTTQVRVLNHDGTQATKSIPGVPKIDSQLLASAALDMTFDGHLSRRNQQLLHQRGIQLAPLGLVTYQQWLKQRMAAAIPPNQTTATGKVLPG